MNLPRYLFSTILVVSTNWGDTRISVCCHADFSHMISKTSIARIKLRIDITH